VPPEVTAATGLDALTHCIEAYANRSAHPLVDPIALEGIRLIGRSLLRAVSDGENTGARGEMALGSLYGGLCLGPVNTAAVHALAYPLGGRLHIAHGVSNAVLLPHVMEFNLPAMPERYARIALSLGVGEAGGARETALRGVETVKALASKCAIPTGLAALGVTADAIPAMAAEALTVTRILKNNPRELTQADAEAIYWSAMGETTYTENH
jgi:alcohol dehydrogenase class IV